MVKAAIVILLVFLAGGFEWWSPRVVPPLHLPPQQVVETRNPKIGIHLRLSGTDDDGEIDKQMGAVREMGGHFVVDLFPWAYVQPLGPQQWEWRGADLLIEHANRQGLEVVARLDLVPAWARPPKTSDRLLDPDHVADFARYAAAFARRYAGKVRYVQIWNEPNLNLEWGLRDPDPAAYAALLGAVVPAIKAVNPAMQVLSAGLSPGNSIPGVRMDDLQFLHALLAANAPFDLLGTHAYGAREPADEPPDPGKVNFRRVEVYRDVLRAAGYAQALMITEGGWNDHPRWSGAVTPRERIEWSVEAYRLSEGWSDVVAVCLWEWQTSATHSYADNYTFVMPDGTPKAIYYAVQRYARGE